MVFQTLFRYLFVSLLCLAPYASATLFYSLDTTRDELVTLDSTTGTMEVVGSLGFDVVASGGLEILNGRLFGIATNPFSRVDLIEIDPNSGAVIASAQVTSGGSAVTHAEALTRIDDQLLVGFTRNNSASSNTLGTLRLDGTVEDPILFSSGSDFDSLGVDDNGQLYSFDGFIASNDHRFFSTNPNNTSQSLIRRYTATNFRMNDMVFLNNSFFATNHKTNQIHQVDINNGDILTSINISNAPNPLVGLVLASEVNVVPEPGTLALLCFSLLLFFRKMR